MKWVQILLNKLDRRKKAKPPRVKLGRNFNKAHFLAPAHKAQVLGIVGRLPKEVVNYVGKHILFISTCEGIKGVMISFRKGQEARKDVIWLNPELWSESEKEIRKVVLHEIAHSYMKHYGAGGFDVSKSNQDREMARYIKKFKKTEDEANNKAKEWMNYAKNTGS